MSWFDETDKLEIWHEAARGLAVKHGFLHERLNGGSIFDDSSYMLLYAQWIEVSGGVKEFASGKEAALEFGRWLSGEAAIHPRKENQVITAQIQKNYGGVSVTFGYTAVFDIEPERVQAAYRYAVEMVNRQFADFEANGLAQQASPSVHHTGEVPTTAKFISDSIEVEIKDGERFYKIKGGQYKKFGLRVWPEVLVQAGIDHFEFASGSNHFVRECVALVEGGKAKKVVTIK